MEDNLCESVSSVSLVITGLIPTSSQVTSKEKFDIHSMSSCKSIALRKKIYVQYQISVFWSLFHYLLLQDLMYFSILNMNSICSFFLFISSVSCCFPGKTNGRECCDFLASIIIDAGSSFAPHGMFSYIKKI